MASCRKYELDIVDYLDGTLSGSRLEALEAHLAGCPDCARRAEDMRRILRETAALNTDPPAGLHEAIMARIDRAGAEKSGRILRFPTRRFTAVAAAALLLICTAAAGAAALRNGWLSSDKSAADSAVMERALMAENHIAYSAYAGGALAEDAEEADLDCEAEELFSEDDMPMEEAVPEEAPEQDSDESAAAEEEEVPASMPGAAAETTLDDGLFDALAGSDARYCAVILLEAAELPDAPEDFLPGAERLPMEEHRAGETAYCASVPAGELDALLGSLTERYRIAGRFDGAAPGAASELIDPAAEEVLVILRRAG